ncbi:MAG: FAD-dependent oxidoreductase [Geodermatophilaceae bacterium]|nr:FAD-dependent oxidoreductase [Geodermatophilaceae bacterium]MDQ3465560.1 FAD-dependent oxidoreductase [Actinomycetota bacterium]
MTRLVVIGGDAAGMSAASQARRMRGRDELEIVALERGGWTSYSACGIPYYVGGLVDTVDELISRTPSEFRSRQHIDVRMRTEATAIDLDRGMVSTRGVDSGAEETLGFDQLMIATGARPLRPDVPGLDAGGVYGVVTLDDAMDIRRAVVDGKPRRAVVLGGGYIGVEMAEMLLERGLEVTVVLADPLPLALLDEDMGERVCAVMTAMGIDVVTCSPVTGIETGADGRVCRVVTETGTHDADIVVLGLGVRPDASLGRDAGLAVGDYGGLLVDERQACRENVWAAGDCTETIHRLTGKRLSVALGTHANRQGRIAGTNIGGGAATFPGVLGTAITKVGECEIGRTGLATREIEQEGLSADTTIVESTTRAGYYPGAASIVTKLLHERGTGRLLGAQIVGGPGSGKRIDVFAAALWNDMTVADIAGMDLSYAPPFSPTFDPVTITARKAAKR